MTRPHILVNVAMTADGKLDTAHRRGAAISSTADLNRVDRLRAGVEAVLVGGHTLLEEMPKLTVRSPGLRQERIARGLPENPLKVGVVTCIGPDDLPSDCDFLSAGPAQAYIFTTQQTNEADVDRLRNNGALVTVTPGERVDLQVVFETLHEVGIQKVLVEGGGTLVASLFSLGLVDELYIYLAPRIFGGASAPTLADGPGFNETAAPRLHLVSSELFDEEGGILLHYKMDIKE